MVPCSGENVYLARPSVIIKNEAKNLSENIIPIKRIGMRWKFI